MLSHHSWYAGNTDYSNTMQRQKMNRKFMKLDATDTPSGLQFGNRFLQVISGCGSK
jgi:hypothetical protein